jgi:N-methylhydantoinase A/oxoprolinase/acetone carboxylase beta subunit
VDVGGSSTHVGVLVHGFPRASSLQPEIGGVRMDFRMPEFLTVPLGGGSVVSAARRPARCGRAVGGP